LLFRRGLVLLLLVQARLWCGQAAFWHSCTHPRRQQGVRVVCHMVVFGAEALRVQCLHASC
jgi:hypothetical protein